MLRKLGPLSFVLMAGACTNSPLVPSGPTPQVILTVSDTVPGSGMAKHDVAMVASGLGFVSVKSDVPLTVSVTPPSCEEWDCSAFRVFSADGNRRFIDVQRGDLVRVWVVSPMPTAAGRYDLEVGVIPDEN